MSLRAFTVTVCFFLGVVQVQAQDDPPEIKGAEPEGLKALKHADPKVRYNAADLLARLGPIGKFAVADLKEMAYKDTSGVVRVKAVEALWKIDPPLPSFVVPVLEQALRDKDVATRASAPAVLALMGKKAKSAVPALIAALKDKSLDVKMEVIYALGELGPVAKEAAAPLLQLSEDKDFMLLEPMAGASLANLGPDAAPVLAKALADKQADMRRLAAYALSAQNAPPATAMTALQTALADKEPSVRGLAAKALGRMGTEAKEASPGLKKLLTDEVISVRIHAALALWHVERKADGMSVLLDAFADESAFNRQSACVALSAMGPAAKDAVPPLILALYDTEAMVRGAAADALGRIGKAAAGASPSLLAYFREEQVLANRAIAALAYWRITNDAKVPLKVFGKVLDGTAAEQKQALALLVEMGKAAEPVVPRLLEMYQESDSAMRRLIAESLKQIDPAAGAKARIK